MSIKLTKLLFIIMLVAASCSSKADDTNWIESLPKPWTLSEDNLAEILPQFHKKFPNFEDRLKAITLWRIGTPYEIFKLGEEQEPDTDPIFRLDVSDCTVHVLTSLSMAQSDSWEGARENIIKLHYKIDNSGKQVPNYESRWHFTTNRILSNPSTVNITEDFVKKADLETLEINLNKKNDGSKLLDLDWSKNVELSYIPNENINSKLLEILPQVCGIAFVRKSYFENGLAVAHEGILVDQEFLVHASSIELETVNVNFIDYYFTENGAVFDGIMIYKFVPLS